MIYISSRTGPVKLLTNPPVAGYRQNPISVYFCYSETHVLDICIAEVTNTPWGDRVTFLFKPQGETVPKSLHVSPFMDMDNTWYGISVLMMLLHVLVMLLHVLVMLLHVLVVLLHVLVMLLHVLVLCMVTIHVCLCLLHNLKEDAWDIHEISIKRLLLMMMMITIQGHF